MDTPFNIGGGKLRIVSLGTQSTGMVTGVKNLTWNITNLLGADVAGKLTLDNFFMTSATGQLYTGGAVSAWTTRQTAKSNWTYTNGVLTVPIAWSSANNYAMQFTVTMAAVYIK